MVWVVVGARRVDSAGAEQKDEEVKEVIVTMTIGNTNQQIVRAGAAYRFPSERTRNARFFTCESEARATSTMTEPNKLLTALQLQNPFRTLSAYITVRDFLKTSQEI